MTSAERRETVRYRAMGRCEYCLLSQEHSFFTHHIEHVIAKKHGGMSDLANLALACHRCNLHKGTDLSGIDPLTKNTVHLYHPRRDGWWDHFRVHDAQIEGISPTGRATVHLFQMNDARRVDLRLAILAGDVVSVI